MRCSNPVKAGQVVLPSQRCLLRRIIEHSPNVQLNASEAVVTLAAEPQVWGRGPAVVLLRFCKILS